MKPLMNFLLALAMIVSSFAPVAGQAQSQANQQGEPKLRISTAEVTLDVVVRDKKGRPVKDLTATDFEVYEDGERQRVESFRLALREPGVGKDGGGAKSGAAANKEATAAAPIAARDNFAGPSVIALVFDRLAPSARALARKAALAYADEGIRPEDFAGVFLIDLSLHSLQPYTNDPKLVRQAVDHATTTSSSTFASNTEQTRSLSERSTQLERQVAANEAGASSAGGARDSAGASSAGAAIGQAATEQMLAQMNERMLTTFETLERDQQGYATINGMLAIINSMRNLPGRKTIVFFSEGLAIPPSVATKFYSVISAANRANVSIYPIDSAGLRVESADTETRREINAMAERRMEQVHRGRDDTSGPMTKALERNEDLLRLSPHSGLGMLADQTGGFLIRETNDLGAGLRRIDEDMRAHYLLTYIPKKQEFDGRFRQISVKLNRPNLDAQTRKGYYAVDAATATPVLDYEAPALAALSRARNANPFALRVSGLNFPEASRMGLAPILAEVPMSVFTFTTDKEKKTYGTDFSIVALVRDESNQVVQKLSRHYLLNGPNEKLEAARKGEVLFYRETELPPGRYTVEAVAYDAPTGKASVKTANLEVTNANAAMLRLSSVVLLKRAERLAADDQQKNNPFHFGEALIYPNTGEPLRKSAVKQLAFFFTAWPARGFTGKLKLKVEVLQNGRNLAQIPAELPVADERGRVQYASALPLDSFQPGAYELRVTVKDEQSSVSRSTPFLVEP